MCVPCIVTSAITRPEELSNHCPTVARGLGWIAWLCLGVWGTACFQEVFKKGSEIARYDPKQLAAIVILEGKQSCVRVRVFGDRWSSFVGGCLDIAESTTDQLYQRDPMFRRVCLCTRLKLCRGDQNRFLGTD